MTITTGVSRTKKVLLSYARMLLYGFGILAAAIVIARLLNAFYPLSLTCIKFFEYTGYLGWCATLGASGWDLQAFAGDSASERLNENLAKIFSIVGIFSFVLARELIPPL